MRRRVPISSVIPHEEAYFRPKHENSWPSHTVRQTYFLPPPLSINATCDHKGFVLKQHQQQHQYLYIYISSSNSRPRKTIWRTGSPLTSVPGCPFASRSAGCLCNAFTLLAKEESEAMRSSPQVNCREALSKSSCAASASAKGPIFITCDPESKKNPIKTRGKYREISGLTVRSLRLSPTQEEQRHR